MCLGGQQSWPHVAGQPSCGAPRCLFGAACGGAVLAAPGALSPRTGFRRTARVSLGVPGVSLGHRQQAQNWELLLRARLDPGFEVSLVCVCLYPLILTAMGLGLGLAKYSSDLLGEGSGFSSVSRVTPWLHVVPLCGKVMLVCMFWLYLLVPIWKFFLLIVIMPLGIAENVFLPCMLTSSCDYR